MKENISTLIVMEGIYNCRDLGGMKTQDGSVIKKGKLIRSSDLHKATLNDEDKLADLGVKNDVDLRTEWEILAAPDNVLKGWSVDHFPVFHEKDIEEVAGSIPKTIEEFTEDSETLITKLYPAMLLDESAIQTWKRFFKLLLSTENSTIYHCTEGKDRTGIASILIEAALGVDEESIKADYLATNNYISQTLKADVEKVSHIPVDTKKLEQDMVWFLKAEPVYYEAAKNTADHYGGWLGYLKEVIGLSDQDIAALKSKYLEKSHE